MVKIQQQELEFNPQNANSSEKTVPARLGASGMSFSERLNIDTLKKTAGDVYNRAVGRFTLEPWNPKEDVVWSVGDARWDMDQDLPKMSAEGAPPVLLGGVQPHFEEKRGLEVGIDWLTCSFDMKQGKSVSLYFEQMFGCPPEVLEYGKNRYDQQFSWDEFGCTLYFDSSEDRCLSVHNGKFSLVLSGRFWSLLDRAGMIQVCRDLKFRFWASATRLDVALDDYDRRLNPTAVYKQAIEGLSGFRRIEHVCPEKLTSKGVELLGDTVYFGSRGKNGSGKFLRVYDKALESVGECPSVRWEVEFSQDKASEVFFQLACIEDATRFGSVLGGLIGGVCRFVERTGHNLKNTGRLCTQYWWDCFIKILGVVRVRGAGRVKIVEKTKAWIENSLSGSLAMIAETMSQDEVTNWVFNVLSSGKEKMTSAHTRAVRLFYDQNFWDSGGHSLEPAPF